MNQHDLPFATAENLPSKKIIEEGIQMIDELLNIDAHKNLSFKDLEKYFFGRFTTIPAMINLQFPLPPNIYRARLWSDVQDNTIQGNFSYPNSAVCTKPGRAHLAGYPVFYGSLSADVAAIETGSVVGDRVYLSKWKIKESAQLNSFQFLFDPNVSFGTHWKGINESAFAKYNDISQNYPQDTQEAMKMLCTKVGQLFTSPDYAISSFLGHYYLYDFPKTEPRADVIVYPSMRTLDDGINYAFAPSFVDKNFILEEVQDITIVELSNEGLRFNLNQIGKPHNEESISWHKPIPELKIHNSQLVGVAFSNHKNQPKQINHDDIIYSNGKKTSYDDLVKFILKNEFQSIEQKLYMGMKYAFLNTNQESDFKFDLPMLSTFLELNGENHYIVSIVTRITYSIEVQ